MSFWIFTITLFSSLYIFTFVLSVLELICTKLISARERAFLSVSESSFEEDLSPGQATLQHSVGGSSFLLSQEG